MEVSGPCCNHRSVELAVAAAVAVIQTLIATVMPMLMTMMVAVAVMAVINYDPVRMRAAIVVPLTSHYSQTFRGIYPLHLRHSLHRCASYLSHFR